MNKESFKTMKKVNVILSALLAVTVLFAGAIPVNAASAEVNIQVNATDMNTSVTVPTQIPIVFNEDGTNTYPQNWMVQNESAIAGVYLHQVRMDAGDSGWKVLASTIDTTQLSADTKSVKFSMGKTDNLKLVNPGSGTESAVGVLIYGDEDIMIPAGEEAQIGFQVERGAFTESIDMQKAFDMELTFKFI